MSWLLSFLLLSEPGEWAEDLGAPSSMIGGVQNLVLVASGQEDHKDKFNFLYP